MLIINIVNAGNKIQIFIVIILDIVEVSVKTNKINVILFI